MKKKIVNIYIGEHIICGEGFKKILDEELDKTIKKYIKETEETYIKTDKNVK